MSSFKIKKLYVIKYEYEQSYTVEYKRQWWKEEDSEETFIGPIVINDRKYVCLDSARGACRSKFHDIVSGELDWVEFMYDDQGWAFEALLGYNDYETDTWDWVDARRYQGCGPDYLDDYAANGEYYDNCWQWSASVCIILSGEHSRFHVRNILLCLRNMGLNHVMQLSILCYLGILNDDFQLIEGAIEPY
jgi:hypothetical protein